MCGPTLSVDKSALAWAEAQTGRQLESLFCSNVALYAVKTLLTQGWFGGSLEKQGDGVIKVAIWWLE